LRLSRIAVTYQSDVTNITAVVNFHGDLLKKPGLTAGYNLNEEVSNVAYRFERLQLAEM
jgi:hypothetical protein